MDSDLSIGESEQHVQRLPLVRVPASSVSLTFKLLGILFLSNSRLYEASDFRRTRILLGEGVTSTVFHTLFVRCGREDQKHVAIKQKRRRGMRVDANLPLSEWLRTCCADMRVMSDVLLCKTENVSTMMGYFWEKVLVGEDAKLSPCMVMPIAQFTLNEMFDQVHGLNCNLNVVLRVKLSHDVANGIASLHSMNIVHGDIKTQNVLVFQENSADMMVAKIADFTHSIFLKELSEKAPVYTGTRPFWVPEVRAEQHGYPTRQQLLIHSDSSMDLKACDVFSLGLMVFTILNDGHDFYDTMCAIRQFGHANWPLDVSKEATENCDSMLDSIYQSPFAFRSLCGAWLSMELHGEIPNSVEPVLSKSVSRCLHHVPKNRCSAAHVVQSLGEGLQLLRGHRTTTTGEQELANFMLSWMPADFPEPQPSGSVLEMAFYMSLDDTSKSSLLQSQIINEIIESLSLVSEGHAPLSLAACYAIGFGVDSNYSIMLQHVLESANHGNLTARCLVTRLSDFVDGSTFVVDHRASWDQAVEDDIPLIVANLRIAEHLLRDFGREYFKERVRRLKVLDGPHAFTMNIGIRLGDSVTTKGQKGLEEVQKPSPDDVKDSNSLSRSMAELLLGKSKITPNEYFSDLQCRSLKSSGSQILSNGFLAGSNTASEVQQSSSEAGSNSPCSTEFTYQMLYQDMKLFQARFTDSPSLYDLIISGDNSEINQEVMIERLKALHHVEGLSGINEGNYYGVSPIIRAMLGGHSQVLKYLLDCGASAKTADLWGTTPLHWLSYLEDDDMRPIAKTLIGAGAILDAATTESLNIEDHCIYLPSGCKPLHYAVAMRNTAAVRTLLSQGADALAEAEFQVARFSFAATPLHLAVSLHFPEIVSELLQTARCSTLTHHSNYTRGSVDVSILHLVAIPLMARSETSAFARWIMHGKHYEVDLEDTIHLILKAFPEAKTLDHITFLPLIYTSVQPVEDPYILRALLKQDIEFVCTSEADQAKTEQGSMENVSQTLISNALYACGLRKDNTSVMDTILQSKYSARDTEFWKKVLSDCAEMALYGCMLSILRNVRTMVLTEEDVFSLQERAVRVDAISVLTLLSTGHESLYGTAISSLLTFTESSYNRLTGEGFTLLHEAARWGSTACIDYLLDKGFPIDIEAEPWGTPLAVAVTNFWSYDAASLLLQRGASVFCKPSSDPGFTILHAVTEVFDIDLGGAQQHSMALLLGELFPEKISDPTILNCRNNAGNTALHIAAQQADIKLVQLLIDLGADVGIQDRRGYTPFISAMVVAAFHVASEREETLPEHRIASDQRAKGEAILENTAARIARLLIANGSPLPELEPITGEYKFMLQLAASLANTKTKAENKLKCFQRLEYPNFKIGGFQPKIYYDEDRDAFVIFNDDENNKQTLTLQWDPNESD